MMIMIMIMIILMIADTALLQLPKLTIGMDCRLTSSCCHCYQSSNDSWIHYTTATHSTTTNTSI